LFAEEFGALDKLAEQRRKRYEKKLQQAEASATPTQETEPAPLYVDTGTKTMQVQRLAQLHPEWSRAQLAQEVGCAASTVTRALTKNVGQVTTGEQP